MPAHARIGDLGLTRSEYATLKRLNTPDKIQRFVYELKQNFEPDGDSCRTVRTVLREGSAHCIEGAMLAACAFWVNGVPPLLFDLRAVRDYDHVVALYRRGGCWGVISKTNGSVLRSRDPVYRSLRELAMSYFHEYANKHGERTLREYSVPYDLRRLSPAIWVTGDEDCWEVGNALDAARHYRLMTPAQLRRLTARDAFEQRAGDLLQYPKPKPRARVGRKKTA